MKNETKHPKFQFPSDEVFLTPEEMEAMTRIAPGMANTWRSRRTGPPFVRRVGQTLYPKSWVLAWLADNGWKPDGWEYPVAKPGPVRTAARRGSAKVGKRVRSA